MATINVLLGIVSIFFVLGVALGALTYAVEGIRGQGLLRRWNLVVAFVLGAFAWGMSAAIGQDFARASDSRLLRQPADWAGMTAVVVWTLITAIILVADVGHVRGLRRPFTEQV